MAFLDEIDRKLTSFGHGAIQKTKEVSDSARILSVIRNLENQQKECFELIGEMVYIEKITIEHEKIRKCIEKIQHLDKELEDSKRQFSRIKGTIICPECKAEIPANSSFCNNCGNKIEQYKTHHISENKCRQCGTPYEKGQKFCTNCGNNVETDDSQRVPEGEEIQKDKEVGLRCPLCNEMVEEDQNFCMNCGMTLKTVGEEENVL